MTTTTTGYRCRILDCPRPATVIISFGEFSPVEAPLCGRHKPTVEQALRRGVVGVQWTVHGYYPHEIAAKLTDMTGHTIRESTVLADLKWLGLTEQHRAADARLDQDVRRGAAGPNVVALRRPRPA